MTKSKLARKVVEQIRANKHLDGYNSTVMQNLGDYEIVGVMRAAEMIGEHNWSPWLKDSNNKYLSALSKNSITNDHINLVLKICKEVRGDK